MADILGPETVTLKPGCRVAGLRPEMLLGLIIAEQVFTGHGASLVVTEATGGKHKLGSLHFVGLAADLRTRGVPVLTVQEIAADLRSILGPQYDVVVEADHVHLEFQPKTGA